MMAVMLKAKYEVNHLNAREDSIPLAFADNFGDAMDKAEEWCEQYEDQMFVGVWLGEDLIAIFDSINWFTK